MLPRLSDRQNNKTVKKLQDLALQLFYRKMEKASPLFDRQRKFYSQQENASPQTNALFEGMRFFISRSFAFTIHVFASGTVSAK